MEYLSLGQKVDIKRSDGRIHTVMITNLGRGPRAINVEWSESKDVKGKEVTLESLIPLNPNVFPKEAIAMLSTTELKKYKESKSHSCTAVNTAVQDKSGMAYVTGDYFPIRKVKIPEIYKLTDAKARLMETRIPTLSSSARGVCGLRYSAAGNITSRTSRTRASSPTGSALAAIKGTTQLLLKAPKAMVPNAPNVKSPPAIAVVSAANTSNTEKPSGSKSNYGGNKRSSHVVRRVEDMKDNREKRRAQLAEMRKQRQDLKNSDPDNPNWEIAHMIREHRKTMTFYPLRHVLAENVESAQITVCVRKRPLSRKERLRKEVDVISVPRKDMLTVHEPRNKVDLTKFLEHHMFRFDYAFDDFCNNDIVYEYTAKPLVSTIFEGGKATCFAYGQTGSGKTHTMGGEFTGKEQNCEGGIYAMAARDVFRRIRWPEYRQYNFTVSCSFFEIYGGKVYDLLTDKKVLLRVLEDGHQQVQIVGLTEKVVEGVFDVLKLIEQGNNERTSGQTAANIMSSRSHAIFQILLRTGNAQRIYGKFSFIDLAGNERGADTSSSTRQTRMEGAEINKSLLALKECIRAMGRHSSHLPFRVSKLTQVLRDSFIGRGNNKTCMIAMISPGLNSCEHTLNTLRYADRVKELVAKDNKDDTHESSDQYSGGADSSNDDDVDDERQPSDSKTVETFAKDYKYKKSFGSECLETESPPAELKEVNCTDEDFENQMQQYDEDKQNMTKEKDMHHSGAKLINYSSDNDAILTANESGKKTEDDYRAEFRQTVAYEIMKKLHYNLEKLRELEICKNLEQTDLCNIFAKMSEVNSMCHEFLAKMHETLKFDDKKQE